MKQQADAQEVDEHTRLALKWAAIGSKLLQKYEQNPESTAMEEGSSEDVLLHDYAWKVARLPRDINAVGRQMVRDTYMPALLPELCATYLRAILQTNPTAILQAPLSAPQVAVAQARAPPPPVQQPAAPEEGEIEQWK